MEKYHKINGLYKRDERGNFTDDFSRPEFRYLFHNEWVGTEKFDGTNIRIVYDSDIHIHGRTDKAQIPTFLLEVLIKMIPEMNIPKVFPLDEVGDKTVILFGEGYGKNIQKVGSSYLPNSNDFILFDVKIGDWWLKREDVDSIAEKLGIKSVPTIFRGTLQEAIDMVSKGFDSTIGTAKAEGLVLTPSADLHDRAGNRIITKLKTKDFA